MFTPLFEFFEIIFDFMASGGDVLKVIFFVSFLMWILIIERFLFFKKSHSDLINSMSDEWSARDEKKSWFAKQIREFNISSAKNEFYKNISLIKTLVSVCPLLGLLGTVTGMIAVFDVMALTGTGNARLMASGISMATIPTMAGMVTALSGLYFGNVFEGKAKKALSLLDEKLSIG